MAQQIAKKTLIIIIAAVLALVVGATTLISCLVLGKNAPNSSSSVSGLDSSSSAAETVYYDNENDPLVFSSQEVDKVFNPFFSTAAADSNVVGLTQIGMIGNDKEGNPVWGDNEAVITKDLEVVTAGTEGQNQTSWKATPFASASWIPPCTSSFPPPRRISLLWLPLRARPFSRSRTSLLPCMSSTP